MKGPKLHRPRFVAIYSMSNGRYLRYLNQPGKKEHGYLQFSAYRAADPFTKFEIVTSTAGKHRGEHAESSLVHLKCCSNNKYWAMRHPEGVWLHGGADEPEENRSKWTCTLFQLVQVQSSGPSTEVRIRVQRAQNRGQYVWVFDDDDDGIDSRQHCLCANAVEPEDSGSDLFTVIDWESLHPGSTSSAGSTRKGSTSNPDQREKHRFQGEEDDYGLGDGDYGYVGQPGLEDGDVEQDGLEDDDDDGEAEEATAYTYSNDGREKVRPTAVEDVRARPKDRKSTADAYTYAANEKIYEEHFVVVSSANDFWGALFASTDILPTAHEDLCSSIDVVKGDGFSEQSVRKITLVRGKQPQWKDWVEEIVHADHEKMTIEWSAVRGGPLNQCGIFKNIVTVSPRMRKPKGHGAFVKWSCRYTDLRGFPLEAMKSLVESTFKKLDEFLLRMADRELR